MKCEKCHTLLPEFGQFQKKVCPNCGAPIMQQTDAQYQNRVRSANSAILPELIQRYDKLWKLLLIDIMVFGLMLIAVFLMAALDDIGINIPPLLAAIPILLGFLSLSLFLLRLPFEIVKRGELISHAEGVSISAKRQQLQSRGVQSVLKLVIAAALCIGVCLFLGFVCFGISQQVAFQNGKDEYEAVTAQIIQIDEEEDAEGNTTYTVWVSYDFDGQHYPKVHHQGYNSTMKVGQELTVYIDPENPGKLVDNGVLFTVVFSIFAAALFIPFWFTGPRHLFNKQKTSRL